MKAFRKWLRSQLDQLDKLDAICFEIDDPGDVVELIVQEAADKASQIDVDLYRKSFTIRRNSIGEARWYLTECQKAIKTNSAAGTTTFTVSGAARLLKVNRDKVLGWINRGELQASNTANQGSRLPRYLISRSDLDAFLVRRTKRVKTPAKRQRRLPVAERRYYPES
jgi:excisionase family DNA binding protein